MTKSESQAKTRCLMCLEEGMRHSLVFFLEVGETTFGFSCIIYTYMVMASLDKKKEREKKNQTLARRPASNDIAFEHCLGLISDGI